MSATVSMLRNAAFLTPGALVKKGFSQNPSSSLPYNDPNSSYNSSLSASQGGPSDEKNSRYNVKKTQDLWTESLRKRTTFGESEETGQRPISMSEEAEKRKLMLQVNGIKVTQTPFAESKILKSAEQAFMIYYCLPFHNVPPTRLLFGTWQHGNSLSTLHTQCDGNGATVILAKSGDYIFGGYASTSWNTSQIP